MKLYVPLVPYSNEIVPDSIRPLCTSYVATEFRTSPQGPAASTFRSSVVAVPVTFVPVVVRFRSRSHSAGQKSLSSCSTMIPSGLLPTHRAVVDDSGGIVGDAAGVAGDVLPEGDPLDDVSGLVPTSFPPPHPVSASAHKRDAARCRGAANRRSNVADSRVAALDRTGTLPEGVQRSNPRARAGPAKTGTLSGIRRNTPCDVSGNLPTLGTYARTAAALGDDFNTRDGDADEPHATPSLRRSHSRRPSVPGMAREGASAVPSTRRPFHRANHARGPGAQSACPLDSWPLLPRGCSRRGLGRGRCCRLHPRSVEPPCAGGLERRRGPRCAGCLGRRKGDP